MFNSFKTGAPIIHSVHPPPFCRKGGGGGETSTEFSKKEEGGLTGPQFLEGVVGKEVLTFFNGVAVFT